MLTHIMLKKPHAVTIFLFLTLAVSSVQAYVSFSSSVTTGVYRDDQLNTHLPLFYNLSYSGLHSNGAESSIDLILNNDLYENKWTVIPSNAVLTFFLPENFQHANGRRSRLAVGRQLFAESFDLTILDGAQLPVYWSSKGGVSIYGGSSHVMDLADSTTIPLAGGSLFQEVEGFHLKAGFSSRQNTSTQQVYYGSVHRDFESLPFAPSVLTKTEIDQSSQSMAQSLTELDLNPMNALTIYGIHSYRNPRATTNNKKFFVYEILSQSAQETLQGGAKFDLSDRLFLHGFGRGMRYRSGISTDTGSQQEISLTWMLDDFHSITPVWGHIFGYGGELWDSGLTYRARMTDTASWQTDLAAAYLTKVNGITGWAYQVRNGMDWLLASRWTTSVWTEVERNHLFEFDARLIAHVTYFH